METQNFLREYGLKELCERFKIRANRHSAYPNLVQLKYSQIFSPMQEIVVQQCRGLIVDEADDWRIIARAYDKFFNLGEPNAVAIDWSTAKVYEKLDGSLMTAYWYGGQWHVASSGMPDAAGSAQPAGVTFAHLFRQTFAELGYAWPDAARDGMRCFMLELMTPQNRIIVSHDRPRIVLHGVRNLQDMAEAEPDVFAGAYGWECVRTIPLATAADCLSAAELLEPQSAEGFVVRDAAFRRVKVKSPRYVALAHMKDSMTGRRMLEIIRSNESDEMLAYFPDYRPAYERIRAAYDSLCDELEADYVRLRGIPDQRAFAAEAMNTRTSSPLFAIRGGKCKSVREFFAGATFASVERSLGVDLDALLAVPQE